MILVMDRERSAQEGGFPQRQGRRLELSQVVGVCLSTFRISLFPTAGQLSGGGKNSPLQPLASHHGLQTRKRLRGAPSV